MRLPRPVLLTVALLTATAAVSASAAESTPGVPADCHAFTDDAGDSFLIANNAATSVPEPTRDILSVDHSLDGDQVNSKVTLTAVEATPSRAYAEVLTVEFKLGNASVQAFARRYANREVRTAAEPTAPLSGLTVNDKEVPDAEVAASFDPAEKVVSLSYPAAAVAKAAGLKTLRGATATSLTATYAVHGPAATATATDAVVAGVSDSAEGAKYVLGACDPPPVVELVIKNAYATTGQHSDAPMIGVKLTDAAGEPVPDRVVTFTLGGLTAKAKSGAEGFARIPIRLTLAAGRYDLVAAVAPAESTPEDTGASPAPGDPSADPEPPSDEDPSSGSEPDPTLSTPFTVTVEKATMTAAGGKGTVTATLRDDDRTPLANQPVVFTANGKKTTVRTNSGGVAKLGSLKAGTPVTVQYAGVASRYSAASATAKAT